MFSMVMNATGRCKRITASGARSADHEVTSDLIHDAHKAVMQDRLRRVVPCARSASCSIEHPAPFTTSWLQPAESACRRAIDDPHRAEDILSTIHLR